jgi:hypothetical protein
MAPLTDSPLMRDENSSGTSVGTIHRCLKHETVGMAADTRTCDQFRAGVGQHPVVDRPSVTKTHKVLYNTDFAQTIDLAVDRLHS